MALLEPTENLQQLESDGDFTARLALMEEQKTMPFGCRLGSLLSASAAFPSDCSGLTKFASYEADVLSQAHD